MARRSWHRKDNVHAELAAVLDAMCPISENHSQAHHGYDHLIVTARGSVYAVEFKTPPPPRKRPGSRPPREPKLSENEQKARIRWGSRYRVIQTRDEAEALART